MNSACCHTRGIAIRFHVDVSDLSSPAMGMDGGIKTSGVGHIGKGKDNRFKE